MDFRWTPCLHIKLPEVDCGPPVANIAPICAFQAQTSIRTSGLSVHPGAVPGRSTCVPPAVLDDGEPLTVGKSAFAGTTASFTLAEGASFSNSPPPDRCESLQTPATTP